MEGALRQSRLWKADGSAAGTIMIERDGAVIHPLSLPLVLAVYLLAFLLPAWPWLSGAVTIPWDAKSQFFPPVQFLASSLARGEWPWWTPNIFAGASMICDPQSLLFSPLHLLLAASRSQVSLWAFDVVTFAYLFLGGVGVILLFRDRGWHMGGAAVAALAFALGGAASARMQHTVQVISLSYLPLTLWLLARALDRSSWRAGLAAGVVGGLLLTGRDQVALVCAYVLAGYVVAHWVTGDGWRARVRASLRPLLVGGVGALLVAIVPVTMTALMAVQSNRPEVAFSDAVGGSIHPVHLLQLAFADLFGAMSPHVDYWAPQSATWDSTWGSPEIYLSQNMGLLYAGALPLVALLSFGLVRGLAWDREIRFFTVAAFLVLLYTLGGYTPAFWLMYHLLPGIDLFRRPADATFVLVALLAIVAGYLVHRWLVGSVPPARRMTRVLEMAVALGLVGVALALAHSVVGVGAVLAPVATAIVFTGAAIGVLILARLLSPQRPLAAVAVLAAFMAIDLAWNNAPHDSTALPPGRFDALRLDSEDRTLRLLEAKLAADAAPDRRDRVEIMGIDYHWQNLSMVHGFDHVFAHNPLRFRWFKEATLVGDAIALPSQRVFSPLYPSYRSAMADLLGVRFIVTGVPVEQIDPTLRPGDLPLVARTAVARIYENPRALPRVMLMSEWRQVDFDELVRTGWPSDDPRRIVLLEKAPRDLPAIAATGDGRRTASIVRYANTEVEIEVETPVGAILLLNDIWAPWWYATVGGADTEILRANVLFRAVVCPPGRHVVRFTYRPFAGAVAELLGWATHMPVR